MKVEAFAEILGADFYTGVPDSQLKAFCDYLERSGITATVRRELGSDINASCGQLRKNNM